MKPSIRKDSAMKQIRYRSYTLVEMLVVIAVIVILAGLLFPAIRSARESARRAQCLANQKNLGVYVNQYAQNNNQNMNVIANWNTWYRDLLIANGGMKEGKETSDDYLAGDQSGKPDQGKRENCLNATGMNMVKVFKCPSDSSMGATASYGRNNPVRGGTARTGAGRGAVRRHRAHFEQGLRQPRHALPGGRAVLPEGGEGARADVRRRRAQGDVLPVHGEIGS